MFISLYRVIKFALQNFWRNIWLSMITIIILTLTLITVNFLIISNVVARESIKLIEKKIDISVHFKPEISEQDVRKSEIQLLSLPWTKNTKYISKEQTLENFKIKHANNLKILESLKELDSNPMGATLIVTAKNIDGYMNIITILKGDDFKNKIQNPATSFEDYQTAISRISSISEQTKKIGIIASIVFAIITILIVFYTIKIAIYTHKDEIIIMKLVGAGKFFIKAPFLIESILYALSAILLTAVILYPLLRILNPYLWSFFETEFNLLQYFKENMLTLMGWQLLAAIFLNLISSSAALSRYLNG